MEGLSGRAVERGTASELAAPRLMHLNHPVSGLTTAANWFRGFRMLQVRTPRREQEQVRACAGAHVKP